MDPFTGRRGEWREMVFFGPISCLLLESQLSVVIRGGERSDVGGMESERAGGWEWEWGRGGNAWEQRDIAGLYYGFYKQPELINMVIIITVVETK